MKFKLRTMNKVIVSILSVFIMTSCADKEELIGKWEDNIKLSQKSVKFSYDSDSVTINTQGDGWWINNVVDSDSIYYPSDQYNLPFVPVTIKSNSFSVEHRNEKTLFIKMGVNNTGIERKLEIVVQSGNYFDYIYISQGVKEKPIHTQVGSR